ncbi:hypothetical protein F1C16_20660 (plasmid) [Hymenobacter sp. NBH84]|uniref:hypothetical protein n=1 Tax=Hymenobacter sp. NBH84 TaxID=2596915 RepID=UPI0016298F61|nr:hypothetical protein [Hymenobacter sp. NBH84]QNE42036.1 hypothetical protein F1C16_20660 [Hymenobacter sp. NBH84]
MKKKLTVLIVEDDMDAYQAVVDAIETSNFEEAEKGEDGVTIIPHQATTFTEAQQALTESGLSFDAAIIDLKLADDREPSDDENGEKLGGRRVVDMIFKSFQLPMFVYTGTPSHIEALRGRESTFFRIHKRDDTLVADIIAAILEIHQGGLLNLLGNEGVVQTFGKHFHNIFWTHLAPAGEYWLLPTNREALTRYVAQHMTEYLERSSNPVHAGFMPMHPAEMYIAPSIKEKVYTGDILRDAATNELWIVITPACDIVFQKADRSVTPIRYLRKADFIALARLTRWTNMPGVTYTTGPVAPSNIKLLNDYSKQQRYYFLPRHKILPASFVDFQQLNSVPEADIDTAKYERLASVSGPFIKDIIAQLSYYYSRQGAPSLDGGMADWI